MTATVLIPTTGAVQLLDAIRSVLAQTYPTTCYVVCDGRQHHEKVAAVIIDNKLHENPNLRVCTLPINVGSNGFYGHRVYAAFSHLVNSEYILYLDQDNWLDDTHIAACIALIEKNNLDWCYSLRKIYKDDAFVCNDDCESLGKWPSIAGTHHVDTNAYCLRTSTAIKTAHAWHGGWGQDRVFFSVLHQSFPRYDGTGEYTLNYRAEGGEGSVTAEFFLKGNRKMAERIGPVRPWCRPQS